MCCLAERGHVVHVICCWSANKHKEAEICRKLCLHDKFRMSCLIARAVLRLKGQRSRSLRTKIWQLARRAAYWGDGHSSSCDFVCDRNLWFLADRTNGRAIATLLRLSSVCLSSVTLCIVAKRCDLEQKLLWRAYRKSYMRNRLLPKWMTLTFV